MTLKVLRHFKDSWRDRPADCLLLGEGQGPEGEAVRLVYRPRADGVDLFYIRSYEERKGHAEAAIRLLADRHGPVHVQEATRTGRAFHTTMQKRGLVTSITDQ